MKMIDPKSKTYRLFQALQSGEQLTEAQIAQRFGLKNPRATVSNLRLTHGFAVYADEHFDTKGRRTVKYSLGKPSRKVVAAGYRALAQSLAE
jgi:hypothetical protein